MAVLRTCQGSLQPSIPSLMVSEWLFREDQEQGKHTWYSSQGSLSTFSYFHREGLISLLWIVCLVTLNESFSQVNYFHWPSVNFLHPQHALAGNHTGQLPVLWGATTPLRWIRVCLLQITDISVMLGRSCILRDTVRKTVWSLPYWWHFYRWREDVI